jgi:hypothetical protein
VTYFGEEISILHFGEDEVVVDAGIVRVSNNVLELQEETVHRFLDLLL